jgi:hypothetical protein
MLIAGVGFGGAVTLFGVALVDAMRVDTAPQVAATTQAATDEAGPVGAPAVALSDSPAAGARGLESAQLGRATADLEAWAAETTSPRLLRIELDRAVNQDPFQPDRRAPAQRYVLPGQRRVSTRVEREPTPAPEFRVVGTARIGQGGLVLVQVDDGDVPIAVSVGESIEGYRLASVTDEGATFEGAVVTAEGGSWALSVVEPREERRRNDNNRSNNRSRNNRQEQETTQQLQTMIEQGLQLFGGLGRAGFGGRGGNVAPNFVGRGGRRGGGGGGQ